MRALQSFQIGDWALVLALFFVAVLLLAFVQRTREPKLWTALALGLSLPYAVALFGIYAWLLPGSIFKIVFTVFLLHTNAFLSLLLGFIVWWQFLRQGFALDTEKKFALLIAAITLLGHVLVKAI